MSIRTGYDGMAVVQAGPEPFCNSASDRCVPHKGISAYYPQIKSAAGNAVTFINDETMEDVDAIIWCTGYETKRLYPFLDPTLTERLDKVSRFDDTLPAWQELTSKALHRSVFSRDHPQLSFVGMTEATWTFAAFTAQAVWLASVLAGTASKAFAYSDLTDDANVAERADLNETFFGFEDLYFDSPEREKFLEETGLANEQDDFGWYSEFGYTACQGVQMVQLATDAGVSTARIAEYKHYAEAMRAANIEMLEEWKINGNRNPFGVQDPDAGAALVIKQCSADCNGGTFLDYFGGERDTSYRNPTDGKMSPKHHTPYNQAMDDSLECFLDVANCNDRKLLPQNESGVVLTERTSHRAAAARLWRARVMNTVT